MNIYLDASFLVALFVENHEDHQMVAGFFDIDRLENKVVYVSYLTIDETWYSLYVNSKASYQTFSSFSKHFFKILSDFIDSSNVSVIKSFKDYKILDKAFYGAVDFNLRPRDAFHYAYSSFLEADFYTLDSDFAKTDLTVHLLTSHI